MIIPKISTSPQPHIKCLVSFVQDKNPGFLKSHINNFASEILQQKKSFWLTPKKLIDQQYESCLVVPLKISEFEQDKKLKFRQAIFEAACAAVKQLKEYKITQFAIHLPSNFNAEEFSLAALQGCILENAQFQNKKEADLNFQEICLVNGTVQDKALQENQVILQASLNSRMWANQHLSPDDFEQICYQEAQKNGEIRMSVIRGEDLKNRGYNLIYNVGKASKQPPRLIHLEYNNNKIQTALVGKGITFDSGGLNLKVGKESEIQKMHLDKTGACSVLSAFLAAGQIGIKDVSATLAVAENSIDNRSYLPGQIINTLSGLTVEVGNTDAEGRLCLADAFHFLAKRYQGLQYTLIDMATLTGAVSIALGQQTAGVFGSDKNLLKRLYNAGKVSFENIWQLPITEEHREAIKSSKIADLNNNGKGPYGGASQGAAFLEKFVTESMGTGIPWAHLDIAGPSITNEQPIGGSRGFGTRLLLNYLLSLQ